MTSFVPLNTLTVTFFINAKNKDYKNAIIEAVQFLLQHEVRYVSIESFSQNPLENYFGRQRYIGGRKDNPAIRNFGYSDNSIRKFFDQHLVMLGALRKKTLNLPTNQFHARFEIRSKSASLTRTRTRQNYSTRVISDSVEVLPSNDNFYNNLLLINSNTLIESVKEIHMINYLLKHVLCVMPSVCLNTIYFPR